ncbi:transcriptional regulator NrdR [Natrarchaeobaculum sulfurireducens]|uniref:transcriptional regulator NrdR n=1 Tax=Natrarchaeobaculum sulfurireducens TaxID=2044521 RepID=UPI000E3D8907|nr:transcriptional regulator NrdR [Natrarchaeobaculum sulfurireducens]
MNCPDCNNDQTRVLDTETNTNGDAVRRRHECERCLFRFRRDDRPEWNSFQVKKRDDNIEPYDEQKVRDGIIRAVKKRPVVDAQVTELVDTIEADLQTRDERIVTSSLIGGLVFENLRELAKVAYVRFVSVYKSCSDPEDFSGVLDGVLTTNDVAYPKTTTRQQQVTDTQRALRSAQSTSPV